MAIKRVEVWKEGVTGKEKMWLKLIQEGSHVALVVVGPEGNIIDCGYMLIIRVGEPISLCSALNPTIPIPRGHDNVSLVQVT